MPVGFLARPGSNADRPQGAPEGDARATLHGPGSLAALFERSRHAMLLADDDRFYVDANEAACRLLKLPREAILSSRIDDFTVPELRPALEDLWRSFTQEGSQAGRFSLLLPGGERLDVEYSATANIVPGRHLSIFLSPLGEIPNLASDPEAVAQPPAELTRRQREVLGLVAIGLTTGQIGERLQISPETAKRHVRHAMDKLGARNRAHAVLLALRSGRLSI
jgi:DNA-binding CsgD family transcriptional regulator